MNNENVAKIVGNSTYSDSLERIDRIIANISDIPHVPIPEQLIGHPIVMEAQRIAKELSEIYTSLPLLSSTAQNILAEMTYNLSEHSAFKAGISVLSDMNIINASTTAIGSLNKTIHSQDTELSVDLSKPLVELISSIDNSIELPEADSENIVCIKESSNSVTFWNVVSLIISIIGIVLTFYFNYSATTLEKQHHAEHMQELKEIQESITSDPESNTDPTEGSIP